jgi:hypothetical protein
MRELTQLKSSDISKVRSEILEDQHGKCALCNVEITDSTGYSLDHQHKLKSEPCGPDGAGLIRGVLCRACNVLEGKIWNNTQRYMQPKNVQDRIDILLDLVEYYKKGAYPLVHPTEAVREPKVSKRNYNKLMKGYTGKKKFPEYPKSSKLTKSLSALFEEYGISPYN